MVLALAQNRVRPRRRSRKCLTVIWERPALYASGSLINVRGGVGAHPLFASLTSLSAQSSDFSRQAEPSSFSSSWPVRISPVKARQIFPSNGKACPLGVKEPLAPEFGFSHLTLAPLPCGSSAVLSAAVARRRSSLSSDLDNFMAGFPARLRAIDPVMSSAEPPHVFGFVDTGTAIEQAESERLTTRNKPKLRNGN